MSAEPALTPQEHIIPQVEIQCTCTLTLITLSHNEGAPLGVVPATMMITGLHFYSGTKYRSFMFLSQGILENAIKITNEPPTGMHANLHSALDNFDQVSC